MPVEQIRKKPSRMLLLVTFGSFDTAGGGKVSRSALRQLYLHSQQQPEPEPESRPE